MGKKPKNIADTNTYLRYLNNEMPPEERHAFEKSLLEDDFESEALEGLSSLNQDDIKDDLGWIREKLKSKTQEQKSIPWIRIAAAIILLGVFSFVVYFFADLGPGQKEIAQNKDLETEAAEPAIEPNLEIETDSFDVPHLKEESLPKEMASSMPPKPEEIPEQTEETIVEEPLEVVTKEIPELESQQIQYSEAEQMAAREELAIEDYAESIEQNQAPAQMERAKAKRFVAPAARKKIESDQAQPFMDIDMDSQRTITGTVLSTEDHDALPGVNVLVKGYDVGTITDIEGNYEINIPDEKDVILVFSSVGYNSEEIAINNDEDIEVSMEPDVTALSEIVVVAYGAEGEAEDKAYSYKPPQPAGGNSAFKDYIKQNIQYPTSALDSKTKGTVRLKITVLRNGDISNIEVLKSLGTDFDDEAIRLIKEGPKWEPAIENDTTLERTVKVKIRFKAPD